MAGSGGGGGSVICSICYEDLKPSVEDLQAISVCGHVFHELCLQQWFEYCKNKKNSCPVCKRTCSEKHAGRLYFQSVGDQNDVIPSQRSHIGKECPELQIEVKRLELKVSALTSTLEHHQKSLRDTNEELCSYKELAKKEEALKVEALRHQALLQDSLKSKSKALDESTTECSKWKARSMALADELRVNKLGNDLDLGEDEIVKLASFGNGGNHKAMVDVLTKSLAIRNKSYKDLFVKFNNQLKASRPTLKFEKAEERIRKLQIKVQQLETALESKDNDMLRLLKASENPSPFSSGVSSLKMEPTGSLEKQFSGKQTGAVANSSLCSRKQTIFEDDCFDKSKDSLCHNQRGSYITIEDDDMGTGKVFDKLQYSYLNSVTDGKEKSRVSKTTSISRETKNPENGVVKDTCSTAADFYEEDAALLLDDIAQVKPSVCCRNEILHSYVIPQSGPNVMSRMSGKWCNKGQNIESGKLSIGTHGATKAVTGNLIAVGADGRGGQIKVLKSSNQTLENSKFLNSAKRQKIGTKTSSSLRYKGSLQIEHFFGKAS